MRPEPRTIVLTVVRSSTDGDLLSLRAWSDAKGRLSADELRTLLVDAGYRDGDEVTVTLRRNW